MKILFTILMIALMACSHPDHAKKLHQMELFGALVISNNIPLRNADCTKSTSPLNGLYGGSDYYGRISKETRNFSTIVGIDSTMDFSVKYDGFLSSISYSIAVLGNTCCDCLTQLDNVRIPNPTNFLIASACGNDIEKGLSKDQVVQNFTDLFKAVRVKYPLAKIPVVGVHPTGSQLATNIKDSTNADIKAFVLKDSNSCFYDPMPLFNVAAGQKANPSDLMNGDPNQIHYNQAMSFKIKSAIQSNCGVSL